MSHHDAAAGGATRERIRAKLRALPAMTTENGCTEAEAMNAAEKAAALMAEYDLTFESVEAVKAERYGARKRDFSRSANARKKSAHEARWAASAVARFLDCRVWESGSVVVFFGSEHDTEVAHNMLDLIRVCMDGAFARYLRSEERDQAFHGRALRRPFMAGMAKRIAERLDEMRIAREQAVWVEMAKRQRALVLQTRREITADRFQQYAQARGIKLGTGRSSSYRAHAGAVAAGRAAGDRVGLGGTIGSKGTPMIGKG